MYRSAKYNHFNYELIEYNDVVNTFLLLMKRLRFCCSENYFFLVVHPDILCIVYAVAQLCGCRIVHLDLVAKSLCAIVGLFERLLLRTAVHSFTHHHYHFFFLICFDDFFHLHHQFFFLGFFIRFTRWPKIGLSEDLSLKQAYHNAMK